MEAAGPDTGPRETAPDGFDTARLEALRNAAEKDDPASQFQLGLAYQTGAGVAADVGEAVTWFWKAAEAGHVEGMWRLGCMYLAGDRVRRNRKIGERWKEMQSVILGHELDVAQILLFGIDVPEKELGFFVSNGLHEVQVR